MNLFLFCMMFFGQKGSFPAIAAVYSSLVLNLNMYA